MRILLLICIISASFNSRSDLGETILWGTKQLEWTDFKGLPDMSFPSAAVSACVLHMELSDSTSHLANARIETLFRKNASWVKSKNNILLLHESGHFNIAELFARKLRAKLASKTFRAYNYDREVMNLYNQSNAEMEKYQDQYDRETDFSRNTSMQNAWQTRISSELSSLSGNSNVKVLLRLRN